jgi:phospholipid/cholesterol/gamma-HCH transport system substrate-binding protein
MAATTTRDLGTGLFVLLGFAALAFLLTQTTDLEEYGRQAGYSVTARFQDVAGLKPRAPVTMAGVNIGRVESIEFDGDRLDALVTLRIDARFDRIPDDSDASILTAGLLGSKYVGIGAGGSETYLGEQGEIEITQSAIVLEKLVSKFLFSQAEKSGGEPAPPAGESEAP